jgi:hypothetical protein
MLYLIFNGIVFRLICHLSLPGQRGGCKFAPSDTRPNEYHKTTRRSRREIFRSHRQASRPKWRDW